MLGSHSDINIFQGGAVAASRYCGEVLRTHVCLFTGDMGTKFLCMDDNATPHRTGFCRRGVGE